MTFPHPGQPQQGQPQQGQPQQGQPAPEPTRPIARPQGQPGIPEQPTQQIARPPQPVQPPPVTPRPPQTVEPPAEPPRQWWAGDKLSVVLVLVIISALVLAGLLGGELYARHKADSIVAKSVSCVVQDGASVSFGARPMLLQVMTKTFNGISVETAGNRIRQAKGMKLDLRLDDVHLDKTADSAGTLGSLDAEVTWTSDGIKETAQGVIPVLGDLVSDVTTNPSAGVIQLAGGLGSVAVKPRVDYGKLSLQVVGLTGLGFALPRETVQPALDAFTTALTSNLPMGIHADRVEVTDSGVKARFVTRDATIPNGQQDPCFEGF